jgi:BASS family bile acid:Na+ symporter
MISQLNSFLKIYGKVFGLLVTMAVGALFPQVHIFSFLVQYLLMAMLFFAFLDIEFKPETFQKSVIWVLIANVAVAFASYMVLQSFDMLLALTAFMTAIAPTAIAAPVIIGFIQGKVQYVVTAVLFTNISSAVVIPLTLPFLLGADVHISVWEVLQPVLIVMFVPLILARLVYHLPTGTQKLIRKGKQFSFAIWLVNLFIITANASNFLRNENSDSLITLVTIALISLALCAVNFGWCDPGWAAELAGSQPVAGTKESLLCHLDRADLHQSVGSDGTYVLHFVSSSV